jgi:hypothetical protein
VRLWIGIGLAAAGLAVAAVAGKQDAGAIAGGTLLVTGLLVAFVPWGRMQAAARPSDGLWEKPGQGQRWCPGCGRPAGPTCVHCGSVSREMALEQRRVRRAQQKAARKNG